jgi:uncharacterized membrane protein YgcG
MKKFLLLFAAVGVLSGAPSALAAPARSAPDTVIAKTRGGVLVANAHGAVSLVRANAPVGARVVKIGSRLWMVGLAHTAHVRGVVVKSRPNMLVLTAAHRLFTVGLAGRHPAAVSTNPGSTPQPGDVVGVVVSIDAQGNITATSTEDDGPAGTQQVQATVTAVGPDTITLDVSGDQVTLQVPAGVTVPPIATGTQVTLTVTFSGGDASATEDDQGEDGQGSTTTGTGQGTGDQSSSEDDGGSSSTSTTGSQGEGDSGGGGDD